MLPNSTDSSSAGEIDIFEQYGKFQDSICITLHNWVFANASQSCFSTGKNLTDSYHIYGMLWTEATMTFYVDGVQVWQNATQDVMKFPYYLLVDLGIGGGWPTQNTPSPSNMYVQYVRAYAPGSGVSSTGATTSVTGGDGSTGTGCGSSVGVPFWVSFFSLSLWN